MRCHIPSSLASAGGASLVAEPRWSGQKYQWRGGQGWSQHTGVPTLPPQKNRPPPLWLWPLRTPTAAPWCHFLENRPCRRHCRNRVLKAHLGGRELNRFFTSRESQAELYHCLPLHWLREGDSSASCGWEHRETCPRMVTRRLENLSDLDQSVLRAASPFSARLHKCVF